MTPYEQRRLENLKDLAEETIRTLEGIYFDEEEFHVFWLEVWEDLILGRNVFPSQYDDWKDLGVEMWAKIRSESPGANVKASEASV